MSVGRKFDGVYLTQGERFSCGAKCEELHKITPKQEEEQVIF